MRSNLPVHRSVNASGCAAPLPRVLAYNNRKPPCCQGGLGRLFVIFARIFRADFCVLYNRVWGGDPDTKCREKRGRGPPGASDGPRGTSGCRNQCPWGSASDTPRRMSGMWSQCPWGSGGPYEYNRDRSQPTVPFLPSAHGQRRDTQVPPYEGNVTPFVGRHLCVPPCRVSILINVFMVAGGTVYFVGAGLCSALFPPVAEEPGGAEPRPYEQNRDRSQPTVPFLKSVRG